MRWKQSTALVLAAGVLSGCTTFENDVWGMRYGPSPTLVAETVQTSVARQMAVVAAVSSDVDPATGQRIALRPVTRGDWYAVILTGFNTIDDACMSYVDGLWVLERQKTRNSTILTAAGAAGAAIIGSAQATPSTAAALVVLAQAFGFAGILNNAIFDTYLYTQNAATIKKLVEKMTLQYRTDFAAGVSASEINYPIASPGAAYHHMREYLALCLPPTIQARIEDLVTGAQTTTEKPGGNHPSARARSLVGIATGGSRPPSTLVKVY
jgi:hypothetical protein